MLLEPGTSQELVYPFLQQVVTKGRLLCQALRKQPHKTQIPVLVDSHSSERETRASDKHRKVYIRQPCVLEEQEGPCGWSTVSQEGETWGQRRSRGHKDHDKNFGFYPKKASAGPGTREQQPNPGLRDVRSMDQHFPAAC